MLKELIKNTPIYWNLRNRYVRHVQLKELRAWQARGCPVPPPHIVKQETVTEHADLFKLRIFVETGTYLGDMIEAVKGHFERIYSIELDENLFQRAKRRFSKEAHVNLIQGDSAELLYNIMKQIDAPALFWLDAHYSGGITGRGEMDTPILQELRCILDAGDSQHVIIIDDAREFGMDPGYPTIEAVSAVVNSRRPDLKVTVLQDMIRITPASIDN